MCMRAHRPRLILNRWQYALVVATVAGQALSRRLLPDVIVCR
jgi:hypothetical protein